MRIARYTDGRSTSFGAVEGDELRQVVRAPWEGAIEFTGATVPSRAVRLLCPVTPSKIVACGVNYGDHLAEAKALLPQHDFASGAAELIFGMRAPSVLNGPDAPIVRPRFVRRVDHEAELAVVIGRAAKNVAEADALGHVLGYACYNDCGAREIQARSPLFAQKSKSIDTFGCCGPWIACDGVDLERAKIECRVNGTLRQASTLGAMIRPVAALVAEISRFMTLLPGDLIVTGSPAGVAPLEVGDEVEVSIDGIGTLRNRLVEER